MNVVALTMTVKPTVEPVTLAEVKAQCRVNHTDEDDLLSRYISSRRAWAENYCERAFINQTWQLILDGFPEDDGPICLPRPRANQVTTFQYYDADDDLQTVDSDIYSTLLSVDDAQIYLNSGETWPITGTKPNAVTVTYRTGYGANAASVPDDIGDAILLLVGHAYQFREPIIVGTIVAELKMSVDSLLTPHRVMRYA